MFTVTISEKGGQQSKHDFNKSEITIGRMKGNDIVLPKGNVSKQHTRIFMRDAGFFVSDLKSTNGTYVNGRKVVAEQPISDSDKVYIGDFILQVERSQGASKAPPSPPRPQGGFPSGPSNRPSSPGLGPSGPGAPSPPSPPAPDRSYAVTEGPAVEPPQPSNMGAPQPANKPTLDIEALVDGPGPNVPLNLRPSPRPSPRPNAEPARPLFPDPVPPADDDMKATGTGPSGRRSAPERSRGSSPGGQPRKGSSLAAPAMVAAPLGSEFDEDFHAAQHDVARVLFESLSPEDLPLAYPPEASDRARCESAVRAAIAKVKPRVDKEALADLLTTECVGLGPIEGYLDDPSIADIYVNRYDRVLVRRGQELLVASRAFSHPEFLNLAAHRLLGSRDIPVGSDEVRFSDGTRVHLVMPPIAVDGPVLTVRKPSTYHPSLEELVSAESLSANMAQFLEQAVRAGRSILVAGPTNSGKSTVVSALIATVPNGARLISVEQNSHLDLPQETAVRLEASLASNFDMRYLLRSAVSMHPQRIILDECRGAEAYDWVTAAACGTEGSMLTLHGTSAPDALGRLESLCLLGSTDISPRGLREQIARAVNLVVVVNNTASGSFRVQQITEVQGVDLDAFRLNDVFYYRVEGASGGFHPTGYIPMFVEDLRHAGANVDLSIFRE
ncbi:MAG: ATPase, T2SS/T4P/T4SS family [Bradymonadaceae bacterium]